MSNSCNSFSRSLNEVLRAEVVDLMSLVALGVVDEVVVVVAGSGGVDLLDAGGGVDSFVGFVEAAGIFIGDWERERSDDEPVADVAAVGNSLFTTGDSVLG